MSTKGRGKRSLVVVGLLLLMILALTVWSSWDHIGFWWLFESLGRNEQGYPQYRHRDTGIVMVRVPGGTFMMGSPPRADGFGCPVEEPRHQVALSSFLIAKYEVTQEQWSLVMTEPSPRSDEGENLPVGDVRYPYHSPSRAHGAAVRPRTENRA